MPGEEFEAALGVISGLDKMPERDIDTHFDVAADISDACEPAHAAAYRTRSFEGGGELCIRHEAGVALRPPGTIEQER